MQVVLRIADKDGARELLAMAKRAGLSNNAKAALASWVFSGSEPFAFQLRGRGWSFGGVDALVAAHRQSAGLVHGQHGMLVNADENSDLFQEFLRRIDSRVGLSHTH